MYQLLDTINDSVLVESDDYVHIVMTSEALAKLGVDCEIVVLLN